MTEAQEVRARAKALRERREELEKALAGAWMQFISFLFLRQRFLINR